MKKKKVLSLLLASVMAFSVVLTGCGAKEEAKTSNESNTEATDSGTEKLAADQVLKINLGSNPPDLDPQTATDQVSFEVINGIYEGLVRLNPEGKVEQGLGLAESWTESEDGTVYTFKLRDAKWSDGSPIKASDFEFSWKRAIDPATASQYAYMLYAIKGAEKFNAGEGSKDDVGIKALDDKTLEVTLERPTPYFTTMLGFSTYLPLKQEAQEAAKDNYGTDVAKMVFSGPFKLVEWQQEQKIVLEKNENYWDAANVKLNKIEMDMITDLNTPINLFETGELDIIGVPTEYLAKYRDNPNFGNMATATTWYIKYNCENEYLKNLKIRKALSLALNRSVFVDNVLANGSLVSGGLVPNGIPGKSGEGDFRSQSGNFVSDAAAGQSTIDEANKLFEEGLKEIGKTKDDFQKNVKYITGDSDVAKKFGQAFQQMWKENLGIEVAIDSVTFKVRLDRENKKDYQISFSGWGADYMDPMTFMDMWVTGGGNNTAYWTNAKYDALIEKATTTTGDERMQAMMDAEKILMEELPIAPVYFKARNFVAKDYVKGVVRFPVGLDNEYKWAYLLEH